MRHRQGWLVLAGMVPLLVAGRAPAQGNPEKITPAVSIFPAIFPAGQTSHALLCVMNTSLKASKGTQGDFHLAHRFTLEIDGLRVGNLVGFSPSPVGRRNASVPVPQSGRRDRGIRRGEPEWDVGRHRGRRLRL